MMACGGIVLIALGLLVLWLGRDTEGISRWSSLALGILLCLAGLWYAPFETGQGLARFLPSVEP